MLYALYYMGRDAAGHRSWNPQAYARRVLEECGQCTCAVALDKLRSVRASVRRMAFGEAKQYIAAVERVASAPSGTA
jgi:hypothetical protein